jgi:nickel/cobalt transporter (NicO) family protein
MDESKKLMAVIKHWVEHNESHLDDYRRWKETAAKLGLDSVTTEIEAAVEKLSQSNDHLKEALNALVK